MARTEAERRTTPELIAALETTHRALGRADEIESLVERTPQLEQHWQQIDLLEAEIADMD